MICSCKAAGKSGLKTQPHKASFSAHRKKTMTIIAKHAHVGKAKDRFCFRLTFFSLSRFFCPFPFLFYFLVLFALFLFPFFFSFVPFPVCSFSCSLFVFLLLSCFIVFFFFLFRFCFLSFFCLLYFSFSFFFFAFFLSFFSLSFHVIFLLCSSRPFCFWYFSPSVGKLTTSCYAHFLLHLCAPCSLICFFFYMTCDMGKHMAHYRAIEATN